MTKKELSLDYLKEVLSYDPETGIFTWKKQLSSRGTPGSVAGSISKSIGYRTIVIHKIRYLAHVLAWFYSTSEWPDDEIDHKNGIRSDNRLGNLRPSSHHQNMQNRHRSTRSTNSSGFLGVRLANENPPHSRYVASIQHQGRNIRVGTFPTAEEASAAYIAKKHELHPYWNPS